MVLREVTLFFFAGYLAVSLFLNESHELLLLLVNTVLKVDILFSPPIFVMCSGDEKII